MIAKVGGKVGHPQLVMTPSLASPKWLWQQRKLVLDIVSRALQLQRRLTAVTQQHKRSNDRLLAGDMFSQIRGEPCPSAPVANLNHTVRRTAERINVIWLCDQRAVIARQRFLKPPLLPQKIAAIVERLGQIRSQG